MRQSSLVADVPARRSPSGERERLTLLTDALKGVIKEIGKDGIGYSKLAALSDLEENAIKQFMFRESKNPRDSNVLRQLSTCVLDLHKKQIISSSLNFCDFYFHHSNRFEKARHSLYEQLVKFYDFMRPTSESWEFLGSSSSQRDHQIRLFCYKRDRSSPRNILKSEFRFFRAPSVSEDECFFNETIPDGEANKLACEGIFRVHHNLMTLYYFDGSSLNHTHVHYTWEKNIGHGLAVRGGFDRIFCDFLVFVPATEVEDQTLGSLDLNRNFHGAELQRYREEINELSKIF